MGRRNTKMRTEGARKRTKKSKGRRFRIRTLPILFGLGAVAVAAMVGYLIVQSGAPAGSSDGGAGVAAEADSDPALPGIFVDISEIYGGSYPDSAGHVSGQVDYVADRNSNPPAGGPHWSSACGDDPDDAPAVCGPAPWGIYRSEWEPETLLHNMEHAGVVVWYNTGDQSIIDSLEDVVLSKLEDGKLVVLTPYSDMEEETVAVTGWSRIDKFPVAEYTSGRVEEFIDVHERRFNPENF